MKLAVTSLVFALIFVNAAQAQTRVAPPGAATTVDDVSVVRQRIGDALVIDGKIAPTSEEPRSATCEFLVATDSFLRAQLGVAAAGGDPFTPGISQGAVPVSTPSPLFAPRMLLPTRFPRDVDPVTPPEADAGSALPQIAQQRPGVTTRRVSADGSLGPEIRLFQRGDAIEAAMRVCQGFAGVERPEISYRDKSMPTALALFKQRRYAESLDYYQQAFRKLPYADGGDEAALMIGKLYLGAPGVERDLGKALTWLERAGGAKFNPTMHMPQFDPFEPERNTAIGEAAMILAALYQTGAPDLTKDPEKARKWFDRARYVGHVRACFVLGDLYYYGKGAPRDLARAFKYYKEGATLGDAPAQQAVAEMYYAGEAPGGKNVKLALAWHGAAAKVGNPASLYALAQAFEQGDGIPADGQRALGLYKIAAMAGSAPARNALGTYFYEGRGVEKDPVVARGWFQQAAIDGDPDAMFNLGAMMMKGEGGEIDRTRAWVWLRMAQKGQNPNAAAAVGVLEARMTAEERAAAMKLLSPENS